MLGHWNAWTFWQAAAKTQQAEECGDAWCLKNYGDIKYDSSVLHEIHTFFMGPTTDSESDGTDTEDVSSADAMTIPPLVHDDLQDDESNHTFLYASKDDVLALLHCDEVMESPWTCDAMTSVIFEYLKDVNAYGNDKIEGAYGDDEIEGCNGSSQFYRGGPTFLDHADDDMHKNCKRLKTAMQPYMQ